MLEECQTQWKHPRRLQKSEVARSNWDLLKSLDFGVQLGLGEKSVRKALQHAACLSVAFT